MTALRDRILSVFAIDLRSLAAFRIVLASLVLWDTFWGFSLVRDFYTDDGILPRWARIDLYESDTANGLQYWWSLHMMSGEPWGIRLLLTLQAIAAGCLLIGYRTRLATFTTFVLVVSVQSRNPVILDGGDDLIKCLLFWGMFVPLGALASIDRLRHPPGESELPVKSVVSVGSAALLLQVAMVYFFSAWLKSGEHAAVWYPEFTATYYAVHLDSFATRLGIWLRDSHGLLMALTFATYWIEWLMPIVAFVPVKNAWCRMAAILALWGFHFGTVLTLDIGMFPFVGMCAWLAFLPSEFWDSHLGTTIVTISRTLFGSIARRLPSGVENRFLGTETPRLALGRFGSIFAGAVLVYVFLWNLRETNPNYWAPRVLPRSMSWIGRVLHVDQNWGMFAPSPPRHDGWFVMQGTLADGTRVNLWEPGQSVSESRPTLPSAKLRGQRWRKYFTNIMREDHRRHRQYLAEFLWRRWNREHSAGDPRKEVASYEVIFMEQETPPPGSRPTMPRRVMLAQSPP